MSAASFQSEINEIPHRFSKLLFDVEKLKKPEKIASAYHIASGERILGYIKSTVPLFTLTVDGTVITDHAIYIHPSHFRLMKSANISSTWMMKNPTSICQTSTARASSGDVLSLAETLAVLN